MKNTLITPTKTLLLFGECPLFNFDEFLNDPQYGHTSSWKLFGGFTRFPKTEACEEVKKWTDVDIIQNDKNFFEFVDEKLTLLIPPECFLIIGVNEEIPEFFSKKYRGKIVSDCWKFF